MLRKDLLKELSLTREEKLGATEEPAWMWEGLGLWN
jgi:hypothetical protein